MMVDARLSIMLMIDGDEKMLMKKKMLAEKTMEVRNSEAILSM